MMMTTISCELVMLTAAEAESEKGGPAWGAAIERGLGRDSFAK